MQSLDFLQHPLPTRLRAHPIHHHHRIVLLPPLQALSQARRAHRLRHAAKAKTLLPQPLVIRRPHQRPQTTLIRHHHPAATSQRFQRRLALGKHHIVTTQNTTRIAQHVT